MGMGTIPDLFVVKHVFSFYIISISIIIAFIVSIIV